MVSSIGTFAQNEVLRRRILDTQTEFNRLQVQVSSGKRGADYSSLGENARLSLSLQQSKTVTQTFIQANITTEIRMGGGAGVAGAVAQALGSSGAKALLAAGDASTFDRATESLTAHYEARAVDGVVIEPAAVWVVTARR